MSNSSGTTRVLRRTLLKFSAGTKLPVSVGGPSPSQQWPEFSKRIKRETRHHGAIHFNVLNGDDSLLVAAKENLGGPDARMPANLNPMLLELVVDGVQSYHSTDPDMKLLISRWSAFAALIRLHRDANTEIYVALLNTCDARHAAKTYQVDQS